jgi:hypothetical protein
MDLNLLLILPPFSPFFSISFPISTRLVRSWIVPCHTTGARRKGKERKGKEKKKKSLSPSQNLHTPLFLQFYVSYPFAKKKKRKKQWLNYACHYPSSGPDRLPKLTPSPTEPQYDRMFPSSSSDDDCGKAWHHGHRYVRYTA